MARATASTWRHPAMCRRRPARARRYRRRRLRSCGEAGGTRCGLSGSCRSFARCPRCAGGMAAASARDPLHRALRRDVQRRYGSHAPRIRGRRDRQAPDTRRESGAPRSRSCDACSLGTCIACGTDACLACRTTCSCGVDLGAIAGRLGRPGPEHAAPAVAAFR